MFRSFGKTPNILNIVRQCFSSPKLKMSSIPNGPKSSSSTGPGEPQYIPSNFDKWVLVWVKRYPNKEAIPHQISITTLLNARSKGRVKACHYMMGISIVAIIYNIWSGKNAQKKGDSIHKRHLEWEENLKKTA